MLQMKKKLSAIILLLLLEAMPPPAAAGEWYRGDLHVHSQHSDGDSTVAGIIARAESLGFDFFAITDHDTAMGDNPVQWADPAYRSDRMVLLYGVEWTTEQGHANIWAPCPFDYQNIWRANLDKNPEAAAEESHRQGALFSINHPAASVFTTPWEYPVSDDIDAVEVWNSLYRFPNLSIWADHSFWDGLLRGGRRIPCVGGSDTHMLEGWMSQFWGLGNPTTWVYAEALTGEAILNGIQEGHVSISYAADAARLDFMADADRDGTWETMMGDMIPEAGQPVNFKVGVSWQESIKGAGTIEAVEIDAHCLRQLQQGAMLPRESAGLYADDGQSVYLAGVFKNGLLFRAWILFPGSPAWTFTDISSPAAYYRVELFGKPKVSALQQLFFGRTLALTNPIYMAFPE